MSGSKGTYTSSYTTCNRVQLIKGGAAYFSLLEHLIDQAQHSVQLQVYIFEDDETGNRIRAALVRAAKRNVAVYLLVDGYASRMLSRAFILQLRSAGVQFRYFEPLLRTPYFYVGRRMHHKVAVVDAWYAVVGGVNIADRYNDLPGAQAWLDAALYIEGEAAIALFHTCTEFWGHNLAQTLLLPDDIAACLNSCREEEPCSVRVRRNDWLKGKTEIARTYTNLFNDATACITIMCSYFLPGRGLRKALAKAAARGVQVRVILAGLSDVALAKRAERYLYNWMFEKGIALYEYQPTVLHAKIAVVDAHWVTIGSYNINNISRYASIELNCDVRNRPFAKGAEQWLEHIIANQCNAVTAERFRPSRTLPKTLLERLSYGFVAFVLGLLTFYFPHHRS